MNTLETLRQQSRTPISANGCNPSVGIIVPPSPFEVPPGWEFVLSQPFEGVSYIATVLHNAGYPVRIIDIRSAMRPVEDAVQAVKDIDIVGIATYEDSFVLLESLCRALKEHYPRKKIILGGSLVTSAPDVLMRSLPADLAVLGEGELTILEVVPALSSGDDAALSSIAGLCVKDSRGKVYFTQPRPQMETLEALPVMNLSLWPQVQQNPFIKEFLMSHSRGCYRNCSFCFRTTPRLSEKSIEKFQQEAIVLHQKHNNDFIYFVDLTFAIQNDRTERICEILKPLHIRWSCMSRVQHLTPPLLRKMKEAGCQIILYGFESVDQAILDTVQKGTSPAEIRSMLKMTQDAGIQVGGLFILGLPGETEASIQKTIAFMEETGTACRIKYLSAIPGTEIYQSALKKGIIKNEVEHLRFLSRERGTEEDEFINFTSLPEKTLRAAYKRISSLYIKGPRFFTNAEKMS